MIVESAEAVRRILQSDPFWCVYALGDLDLAHSGYCTWYGPQDDGNALVLVYRGFSPPILFTIGTPEALDSLLSEIPRDVDFSLHIRPEILPLIESRFPKVEAFPVWRMALRQATFRPASLDGMERLGPSDLEAVLELYADGEAAGESPDYFSGATLETGVYFGYWEQGRLAAAAGTHVFSAHESVAAIGNVYTRRDRRGRGLAAQTVSAVANYLIKNGIATIALNVRCPNLTAIRVYERLGFGKHCQFREGAAGR